MRRRKSELFRVLIFLLGLSVCILGTDLAWPGYWRDGSFYRYPVTGGLLAIVAAWWLVILGITFFVLRKIRR